MDPIEIDPLFNEVASDVVGAARAEGQVICFRSPFVAVPRDKDVGVGMGFHVFCHPVERCCVFLAAEDVVISIEINIAEDARFLS